MSRGTNVGTIAAFQHNPAPQYVPASDVNFGPSGVVFPHPLPPSAMVFQTPEANKMLNLPSIMSIYENRRNGMTF
jgi:hypothetical protein